MSDDKILIYHNPRCGKSRAACALLAERGLPAEVVEYLKTPLGRPELQALLAKLGLAPSQLVRKGEADYKTLFAGRKPSEGEILDAMAAHPILMERPVIVRGGKAVIGRPPERLLEIL
jgi:arsenate reductase